MTTGMPELGSKISLISKADIRYEGRLFTVDPQECTIALASVRSFGTEDRETQYPVPAQNQVYDYILFRGSDIKDIRVVNNVAVNHPQPLNDPAIMQLSVPPSLGNQTFQTHPVLGPMGPQMGQFAGGFGSIGTMGNLNAAVGTSLGVQRDSRSMSGSKPTSVLDLIGGSRSTTPASLGSRKSPTNDQGVQAGGSKHDDRKVIKPIQPPNQKNQPRKHSRERRDSRGDAQNKNLQNQNRPTGSRIHNSQYDNYQRQGENYHQRQGENYHQRQGENYHQRQGGYQNQGQGGYQNQGQGYQGYQYNHNQSNQRSNWRAPMRSRGRPRGAYRANPPNQTNKSKSTLKFDNDYDFEQANTEFEELRSQLGKVKLDEAGSSSTKSETNGEVDKKDDSGNETGAGETEQEEEHEVYYDKNKSFFDKISCEAVERAKGKSQRTDWRLERKLNSETFGVAATRRGNYRGRGGYRGMIYRGGYRPNYRQPQRREQQQPQQSSQQGNRFQQHQKPQTTQTESSAVLRDTASAEPSHSSEDISCPSGESENKKDFPEPVMAVK